MNRRALQLVADATVLALAFTLAYLIRFDGDPPSRLRVHAVLQLPYVVLLQLIVLSLAGLHKTSWRYVSLSDLPRIAIGLGIALSFLIAFRLGLPTKYRFGRIPLGVLAADVVLAGVGLVAVRVLRRLQSEHMERRRFGRVLGLGGKSRRVVLIGAGRAGAMVAREISSRPDVQMTPVGFVDDDTSKLGTYIHGIKVLGDTSSLPDIVEINKVDEAIISISNAAGDTIRRLHKLCEEVPVEVKIIPGLYEILGGRVNVSRLRDVRIDDLLGRDPVELDRETIEAYLRGKRVLVTGAGGSIGSELCRQIARFEPEELVLLEQAENALFSIDRELRASWPGLKLMPMIADVCDSQRLRTVFEWCRPEAVFHAAAHKHVPMMELNPGEALKNNTFGTRKVADIAADVGVDVMVVVSTDKAVNPTSVMGATKRFAELYVQAKARTEGCTTKYVAVRFGNVLGSSGSVIPIFTQQIAAGGPVTVTHPDMVRFFMTIPEACQLVMQAASMAEGGEIFVLDMGEPVRIVDLARDMIQLSGFHVGDGEGGIEIVFSGIRPGEKLYEELALDSEGVDRTRHPKIYTGKLEPYPMDRVEEILTRLSEATQDRHPVEVRKIIKEVLPEFREDAASTAVLEEQLRERTPPIGQPAITDPKPSVAS